MKALPGYRSIPVELIIWAIKNKRVKSLHVYLFLNIYFSGKLRLKDEIIDSIAASLGVKTRRTVNNYLNILLNLGWITQSKRSGLIFVVGFDNIRLKHKMKSVSAVGFMPLDLNKFRGFVGAVAITYDLNYQKKKLRKRNLADSNNVTKNESNKPGASSYFPICCKVLGLKLDLSPTTAQQYKAEAVNAGYIDSKENYEKTGIKALHYRNFTTTHPEEVTRIISKELVIQKAELMKSHMRFRSRKKIET